jgi:hypothetical protein
MDKPHRNMRLSVDPLEGDSQPPSFKTVLNILKAERAAFPRVQPNSQPIAHWQSSQSIAVGHHGREIGTYPPGQV